MEENTKSTLSTLYAFCLHNLTAIDISPTLFCSPPAALEQQIAETSLANAMLLISELSKLPTETIPEGKCALLPSKSEILLPRKRKVPQPKQKTRWQQFAEQQNIQKRKRSRKLWDPISKDWKPRWGKGSASKIRQQVDEAIIEMKPGESLDSVIETRRAKSKLLKKKQQIRELKNQVNRPK